MRNVPLAFYDTETTGLDPIDRATWEVAVIVDYPEVDGQGQQTIRYQAQIPLPSIQLGNADPEAKRITHFNERYLRDPNYPVKHPDDVAKELSEVFQGAHIIGMCPDFDILNYFKLSELAKPTYYYQLIDVDILAAGVFLAKGFLVNLPFNTTAACKFLGIEQDQNLKHQAMYDVEVTREYYYRLIDFAHGPKNWQDYQEKDDNGTPLYMRMLTEPEEKD